MLNSLGLAAKPIKPLEPKLNPIKSHAEFPEACSKTHKTPRTKIKPNKIPC